MGGVPFSYAGELLKQESSHIIKDEDVRHPESDATFEHFATSNVIDDTVVLVNAVDNHVEIRLRHGKRNQLHPIEFPQLRHL